MRIRGFGEVSAAKELSKFDYGSWVKIHLLSWRRWSAEVIAGKSDRSEGH